LLAALGDTEADALTGGVGRDWFFVRGGEGGPVDFELTGPLGETPPRLRVRIRRQRPGFAVVDHQVSRLAEGGVGTSFPQSP
jgi:hypothetical protein